jgi:hypothetical protein
MKRYGIELNGVANIQMLLDINISTNPETGLKELSLYGPEVDEILEQLLLLSEYMKAYAKATNNNNVPPYWHEIRQLMQKKRESL